MGDAQLAVRIRKGYATGELTGPEAIELLTDLVKAAKAQPRWPAGDPRGGQWRDQRGHAGIAAGLGGASGASEERLGGLIANALEGTRGRGTKEIQASLKEFAGRTDAKRVAGRLKEGRAEVHARRAGEARANAALAMAPVGPPNAMAGPQGRGRRHAEAIGQLRDDVAAGRLDRNMNAAVRAAVPSMPADAQMAIARELRQQRDGMAADKAAAALAAMGPSAPKEGTFTRHGRQIQELVDDVKAGRLGHGMDAAVRAKIPDMPYAARAAVAQGLRDHRNARRGAQPVDPVRAAFAEKNKIRAQVERGELQTHEIDAAFHAALPAGGAHGRSERWRATQLKDLHRAHARGKDERAKEAIRQNAAAAMAAIPNDIGTIPHNQQGLAALAVTPTGKIVAMNYLGGGINDAYMVKLSSGKVGVYKAGIDAKEIHGGHKDFTMPHREAAAHDAGKILGFPVPPTVVLDGPRGPGSVQTFAAGFSTFSKNPARAALVPDHEIKQLAVFDLLTGNQDRHNGNVMANAQGEHVAIDHGYVFNDAHNARNSEFVDRFSSHGWNPRPGPKDTSAPPKAWREEIKRKLAGQEWNDFTKNLKMTPAERSSYEKRLAIVKQMLDADDWQPFMQHFYS